MNKLIHAYVTDGKDGRYLDVPIFACPNCDYVEWDKIDYSTPDNFKSLTDKLFGDPTQMWERFYLSGFYYDKESVYDLEYVAYLFSNYSRFCALFAEFLRLEDTVDEFGWEECPEYSISVGNTRCSQHTNECPACNHIDKRLKPWAVLVKDAEDVR